MWIHTSTFCNICIYRYCVSPLLLHRFNLVLVHKIKKYGNKIFIITENQTNALREEINMADYKKNGNRCGGYDR